MKQLKKGIIVTGQVIWILQIKFFYRSRIRVLLYNTYVLNMPAGQALAFSLLLSTVV